MFGVKKQIKIVQPTTCPTLANGASNYAGADSDSEHYDYDYAQSCQKSSD